MVFPSVTVPPPPLSTLPGNYRALTTRVNRYSLNRNIKIVNGVSIKRGRGGREVTVPSSPLNMNLVTMFLIIIRFSFRKLFIF